MRTFFVQNPQIPTSFTMVSPHTRKIYEFGAMPVPVGDSLDIERCRKEMVAGRHRLLETDAKGVPLASNPVFKPEQSDPLSYHVYKGQPQAAGPPPSDVIGRQAGQPAETAYSRESGVLPHGVNEPAPIAVPAGVDDEDLGESQIIARRAAAGRKTRS